MGELRNLVLSLNSNNIEFVNAERNVYSLLKRRTLSIWSLFLVIVSSVLILPIDSHWYIVLPLFSFLVILLVYLAVIISRLRRAINDAMEVGWIYWQNLAMEEYIVRFVISRTAFVMLVMGYVSTFYLPVLYVCLSAPMFIALIFSLLLPFLCTQTWKKKGIRVMHYLSYEGTAEDLLYSLRDEIDIFSEQKILGTFTFNYKGLKVMITVNVSKCKNCLKITIDGLNRDMFPYALKMISIMRNNIGEQEVEENTQKSDLAG